MTKDLRHIFSFMADVKDAVNEADRSILFVISSEKMDRDHEVVSQDGLAAGMKDFAKNPAALACHLHRLDSGKSPVIGSWDTDTFERKSGYCQMRLRFATTELGEEYWQLYKARHMRAVSIGFIPMEWHQEKTEKQGQFYVIDELELLEISCVAVGSNREALSKVKGLLDNWGTPSTVEVKAAELTKKDVTDIVAEQIKTLFGQLSEQLEEIKDIIADSQGFAEALQLDGDPEPSESDGKKEKEQKVEVLQNTLTKALENLKG